MPESNCSGASSDIFLLEDENVRARFFSSLDSTKRIQYPDEHETHFRSVEITPERLHDFLTDIDPDLLSLTDHFSQVYHFNNAPEGFTDSEECTDKIEVKFDADNCRFRLSLHYSFLVDERFCSESMVVYGFGIEERRIIDFWRQEAG